MRRSVVIAGVLVLSACSSGDVDSGVQPGTQTDSSRSSTSVQPQTEAAVRALAQEEADRFAAQDYAGAWDLWSKAGKAAISREDYSRMSETCQSGGVPLKVSSVRMESPTEAVVRIGLGDFQSAYPVIYEAGQWRWQPKASDMADYRLGVDELIAKRKAAGECG